MNATQASMPVVLRSAGPDDEQLLADLISSLSAATSFYRFMAGVGSLRPALVGGLLRCEPDRGALLALRREPAGLRAVGHASWVVTPAGAVDIGVVVADPEQGRGVGTALFAAAADRAARAGATSLHLDVHPENRRVAASLRRRLGPSAFSWEHGLLSVEAPLPDAVRAITTGPLTAAA